MWADQAEGLLFKVLRSCKGRIGLRGQEIPRLLWGKGFAKELVDRVQIDGQRINLASNRGFDPVVEGFEGCEAVHIGPHLGIVRVEDMGAVDMHQNPSGRIPRGVTVACHVAALV